MPQSPQAEILMRLVVQNPVPGVAHSLQDVDGKPVDAKRSTSGQPILFEFPVRVSVQDFMGSKFATAVGCAALSTSLWEGRQAILLPVGIDA